MSDRLAVILVSADRKVLEMGLVYTRNAIERGWMPDVRLYLFGPSEVTVATDPDLQGLVKEVIAAGVVPDACSWCSNRYGVSTILEEMGCRVLPIGEPVSQAIRDGYTPMTW